jgi:hypothetical protein
VLLFDVVLLPSWLYQFAPQQYVGPAVVTPHVCSPLPTERVVNVSDGAAATGVLAHVVVPSPSWPYELTPQHHALPASVSPQMALPPSYRLANVGAPDTVAGVLTGPLVL